MHGRSAIWFLILLLALLSALTLWINRVVQPPQPPRDGSTRHDPDYWLTNFNTIKTDRNGNLRHSLDAEEMVHYPDDDSTQLIKPHFVQYQDGKPYTSIRGDRGRVTSDGEHVYFMDNVKVVRVATKQREELTVLTDFLHIIPDQDLAKTDRPVTITEAPRTVIHATGMEYNKALGTLKLYKRVRAHFERPGSGAGARTATNPSKSNSNGKTSNRR